MQDLVTTKDLMNYFDVSANTINNWRRAGMPYIRKSRKTIRYVLNDVIEWHKLKGNETSQNVDIVEKHQENIKKIKSNIELINDTDAYSQDMKSIMVSQNNSLIKDIRAVQLQSLFETVIRLPFDFNSLTNIERGAMVEIIRKDLIDISDSDLCKLFEIVFKE